jgi:membrane protease YdiL (CAAX protease family)
MAGVERPPTEHPAPPPDDRPELPDGVWREPRLERRGRQLLPDWPVWSPFAAALLTLVVAFVALAIIQAIASAAGADGTGDDMPPGVTIAGTFIQDIALVVTSLVLVRLVTNRLHLGDFGLRRTDPRLAVAWLVGIWAVFFLFSYVWSLLLDIKENDDLPDRLGTDSSTAALVAVAILVCVAAPLCEELFFRGFLFTAVRRRLGLWAGALVSGAIFGAVHLGGTDWQFIVPLMVFGGGLCLLYAKTGSIVPGMVLHALNNSLALGVTEKWGGWTVLAMAASVVVVLLIAVPVARRSPAVAA